MKPYIIFLTFVILFFSGCKGFCQENSDTPNKKVLTKVEKLMKSSYYSEYDIKNTTLHISWDKVDEDLPKSFYTALEKKYIGNYINPNHVGRYFTDEKAMAKINSLIELMLSYQYSNSDISYIISRIPWDKVDEDLPKSFYTALEKKYIGNYIYPEYVGEYFTDEKAMANLNNFIDFSIKNGISQFTTSDFLKEAINWSDINCDSLCNVFKTTIDKQKNDKKQKKILSGMVKYTNFTDIINDDSLSDTQKYKKAMKDYKKAKLKETIGDTTMTILLAPVSITFFFLNGLIFGF